MRIYWIQLVHLKIGIKMQHHILERQFNFTRNFQSRWSAKVMSWILSLDQVGVAEMKVIIERTGGLVVLAESFGHSVFKDSFKRVFEIGEESIGLAHNGTLAINCSKDIKIQWIIGPCTSLEKKGPAVASTAIGQGNTTAWKLCGLDKDTCLTVFFDISSTDKDPSGNVNPQLYIQTVTRYRLRSKVDIENVGEDFSCWQRFGADHHKRQPSSLEDPQAASVGWGVAIDPTGSSFSQGNNTGLQWHKDPRLDCLGFHGIFPSNSIPPMVEADTETAEENYLLWRSERGVAEGSLEIPKGEAIPLEYNLAGLNAISFDKGCYIGQELIARSHHRGVIRKRLLPLKFLNESGTEVEQRVAPSSEVTSLKSGKKAGTVTTALGSRGLGLLRLEEAFKESGNLVIKGQEDVKVEPIRPEWWPTEWFWSMNHTKLLVKIFVG